MDKSKSNNREKNNQLNKARNNLKIGHLHRIKKKHLKKQETKTEKNMGKVETTIEKMVINWLVTLKKRNLMK